jgi:hypothetical protein
MIQIRLEKQIERALEVFEVEELSKITGVANIRSSFALKQVEYKTALPLPEPSKRESRLYKRRRPVSVTRAQ